VAQIKALVGLAFQMKLVMDTNILARNVVEQNGINVKMATISRGN
jgi:predicted nucleic acid-binding protein